MYSIKKLSKTKYEIKIEATKAEWDSYVEKAYEENKGKFNVEGFRKGKAPRGIIEKNYGANVFFDEAIDMLFTDEYHTALDKERDVNPINNPEIRMEKFDDTGIVMIAEVEVAPEVELGEYTNLEVKKATGSVEDSKIDAELEQMRARQARFVAVERAAKNGDIAVIDFVGSVDGVEFEGGKAEDYRLELGSKSFIDTFEEQVEGMNLGETKDVNVMFPENYQAEELKGKKALFVVTLKKLEEKVLPELNDEFASNASEFETLAEFKADIRKHMEESLTVSLKRQDENNIIDAVVANATVEIPAVMVERQVDAFIDDMRQRLQYQGVSLEDYAKYMGTTVEDIKKDRHEQAEKIVKTRLVLEAIIKKHDLFVSAEELDKKLSEVANKNGKDLEEYKKSIGNRNIAYVENELLMDKLMEFLTSNNKLV